MKLRSLSLFFLVCLFYIYMLCEYITGYFESLEKLINCLGFKSLILVHNYILLSALSGVPASFYFVPLFFP